MGSTKPETKFNLKERSVRILDNNFELKDVVSAITEDLGKDKITTCFKSSGYWNITLDHRSDADLLLETGVIINDLTCDVLGVSRTFLTVSLFGVPQYITDDELSEKLSEFGCTLKSNWHRNSYPDYPKIENGIRYVRLELPADVKSLPYAVTINGEHIRLKHKSIEGM